MITFLGLLILIIALFGAPLFVVIGSLTLLFLSNSGFNINGIFQEVYGVATKPELLAIHLFTLAGYIWSESNTPKRIINLTNAALGWMPGGLAVVALFACAFFTAFTGASGVTIIALGGLLYPLMLKANYSEKFTLGLLTTSGSLGLLFPPSLAIIIYGVVAGINISDLFKAGILPGILLIMLLSGYSIIKGKGSKEERIPFKWSSVLAAVRESLWEIPMPFLIIFGIYGGFVTATEAAAVLVVYILIVEVFVYGDLNITSDIPKIMQKSMVLVGSILVIMGFALAMTDYLISEEIPQSILEFMLIYITGPFMFLVVLNIFLLVVGFLLDIFSAILVVSPLIIPIAAEYGVDPVHLGIIFLLNLEIGYSTPPVGLNLFIASFRFDKPILDLYKAAIPFIIIMLITLLIVTYIPSLSLFLVK